jgi:chemotaxis protein methyltransferase CheR
MSLLATLPAPGVALEVLGTDLSTKALERATAALWPIAQAAEIPAEYLRAFMLRGVGPQQGKMKAGPQLRRVVSLQPLNLHRGAYPPGQFDLILCRNALMYFDRPEREAIVGRLVERLAPGGYLFLGHAESLSDLPDRVEALLPAVYRLRARPAGAPSGERAGPRAPRAAAAAPRC